MTAVEFLVQKINSFNIGDLRFQLLDAITQAKEMEKKTKYNDIDMIDYAHHILNNDVISPEEWASRYKHQSNKESL